MNDEILSVSNSSVDTFKYKKKRKDGKEKFKFKTSTGIFKFYNLVKKSYLDGSVKLKKSSFDIIKGQSRENRHTGTSTDEQLERFLQKRVKDRREKITDLGLNNKWEYFLTITFDPKDKKNFPDGYSHDQAIILLTKWINNQKHQNKNMSYLLVSEFHKKGQLHFHGLFSNVPKWKFSPAINPKTGREIYKNGVQIFNLDDYKYGYTTISYIQDSEKVSYYLSKYITKELINLKNKKTFWYSRDLLKPSITYHHIEGDFKEYLDKYYDYSYYNSFSTENMTLEIANCERQHNSNDVKTLS